MSKFVPRLTKPGKGNKYYITKGSGGWNPAIKGKPTDSECDVLANCVGYAIGRFNEIAETGSAMTWLKSQNAENFIETAKAQGLKISQTPEVGAVACWQKGATLASGDGAGHVAIVEEVTSPTMIVTSESGFNAKKPFWTQVRPKGSNGNWGQNTAYKFRGFILNPKKFTADEYEEPTKPLKKGATGDDVKWLQKRLKDRKYYNGDIDGYFGTITLGALLAFQFESDLDVDGVCGSKTRQALNSPVK